MIWFLLFLHRLVHILSYIHKLKTCFLCSQNKVTLKNCLILMMSNYIKLYHERIKGAIALNYSYEAN